MRLFLPMVVAALALVAVVTAAFAQEAPAAGESPEAAPAAAQPSNGWLTWSPKDVHDNAVSLTGYQNKTVYVLLFAPDNDKACQATRAVAAFVREHPNKADKILAMCTDATGAAAIRLYLRQEEYTKRVAAWTAEQDAAEAAAKAEAAARGEESHFARPQMPDFVKAIEDELAMVAGRNALMAHHLPFTTCQRDDAMWTWLLAKVTTPESVPRLLKFNPQGDLLNEWNCLPEPNPLASAE